MSEVIEPTPDQLAKLPEQLWPVARRWGMPLLEFAITVSGTNIALDEVVQLSHRFMKVQVPTTVLLNNFSNLCTWVLEARGWTFDDMQECIQDIGRAQQLAQRPRIVLH